MFTSFWRSMWSWTKEETCNLLNDKLDLYTRVYIIEQIISSPPFNTTNAYLFIYLFIYLCNQTIKNIKIDKLCEKEKCIKKTVKY